VSYGFLPRVIEQHRGEAGGPTLIAIGGLHGNEPAGVAVIRTVLGRLRERGVPVRGEVVGLIGNVRALAARRRFLARDLNRLWTPARIAALIPSDGWSMPTTDGAELSELTELAGELDRAIAEARGPVFVIDLHTTSAPGIPFGVIGPTPEQRAFAAQLPLPAILGLEEQLEGVLTQHLATKGCVTMTIEGGQTESPDAGAYLEAVVTIALAASGCIEPGALPELAPARDLLGRARGALPPLIEVTMRHEVKPEHEFRMEPGFANLHRTTAGTLLARDRRGEIRAPYDGLVLLPLYQPQGSDGFFYGRAVASAT
jgi:succinylglutamate desuccinylase